LPYRAKRNSDGSYRVESPNGIKAKKTTLRKAMAMIRLLYMKEKDKNKFL
jgi:hypothetical protein